MQLRTLIFFVTSRCNAKCRTCFYWQELNRQGDLSFAEIDKLTGTMPQFRELWLSGPGSSGMGALRRGWWHTMLHCTI